MRADCDMVAKSPCVCVCVSWWRSRLCVFDVGEDAIACYTVWRSRPVVCHGGEVALRVCVCVCVCVMVAKSPLRV